MYCLIQLYVCVSSLLAPQKPLLKMFAIKAVGKGTKYAVFICSAESVLYLSIPDILAGNVPLAARHVWLHQGRGYTPCFEHASLTDEHN